MRLKGMFTIETSLVLMIAFFVIFSCFYLNIFIYDVTVLKTGIESIVLVASREDLNEEWMKEEFDKLKKSVLISNLSEEIINGDKNKNISVKLDFPIPLFAEVYFKNREHIISAERNEESGADFVRLTEAIKDVV